MNYHYLPYFVDPVAFVFFGVGATWYTLSYVTGIGITYLLTRYRIHTTESPIISIADLHEFLFYLILGILLGGRVGYFLLYYPKMFIISPLEIISPFGPWRGMSQHGGILGVLLSAFLFTRGFGKNFFRFMDFMVPQATQALFWGRIMGNFMSGGLPGRPTEMAIGMYFPASGDFLLRHPSQIYQGIAEGLIPFLFFWAVKGKIKIRGGIFSLWFILHGSLRFGTEYFREPDSFIGLYLNSFTRGQLFCICEIIVGIAIFIALQLKTKSKWDEPFQNPRETPQVQSIGAIESLD